jgi:hypothetical protein
MLIYLDPAVPRSDAESQQLVAEFAAFTQEITDSEEFTGSLQLQHVDTATSVRVRDGRTSLTDGPFAETSEYLGGFYLIEAPDLDRALELAAKIPAVRTGVIEVRPVVPA